MFAAKNELFTRPSGGGYQISRSLRFNSADSAYLNRTPATATNRRTWTWSGWVKRGLLTNNARLFCAELNGSDRVEFMLNNDTSDVLRVELIPGCDIVTTQVFRDPSAWYHIVLAVDTTQATSSNRVKIYVNGLQITSFSSATYPPTQNAEYAVNNTNGHSIGRSITYSRHLDGYMTEINLIDGQALTPSSFGETNAQTGVWGPKAYSGSYGTNGFYLNFSDNSNTTAATLGKDYSGNGNNWTPNNFSVTAGAGNDSLVDSPTSYGTDTGVGGTVRGNYCTWNPLNNPQSAVLTNGNLDLSTVNVTARYGTYTTIGVTSAKWYWEITAGSLSSDGYEIGIASASKGATVALGADTESYIYLVNGDKRTNATTVAYGATYTAGDVIGVALDLDAGTLVFYKNGASQGTAYTSIPSNTWFPTVADDNTGSTTGSSFIGNFGQRAFAYTAPSGYKALCTQNLPTPTIGATTATQAGKYFNPVLYTGTGATQSVTGVGFQPDFTWIKRRDTAQDHNVYDSVRGSTSGYVNQLITNATNAENSYGAGVYGAISAFSSDGFSVASSNSSWLLTNASGGTYVAWNWKANGSGSSNTSGSITSTVSANTTSGFSIVTYTGTGANATVGHGLGVAPAMYITKKRNSTSDWAVYHQSIPGSPSYVLSLQTTDAAINVGVWWNSTSPTSTVFSLGTSATVNGSGDTFVAYCFAQIAGYSAFGSYTGNGSADGPFVFTGFRPAYLLVKRTDAVNYWFVFDSARDTSNAVDLLLDPNDPRAEISGALFFDFLSNGFKSRATDGGQNASGGTYIYMAFASNPFKYSLAF